MRDVIRGLATGVVFLALCVAAVGVGMAFGDLLTDDGRQDSIERIRENIADVELETARLECQAVAADADMRVPAVCR